MTALLPILLFAFIIWQVYLRIQRKKLIAEGIDLDPVPLYQRWWMGLIVIGILANLMDDPKDSKASTVEIVKDSATLMAEAEIERKENLEHQFSPYDGSHRGLEKALKASMNDPNSYEHVETKYWDMKDHLVVAMRYRGNNAFGGKVLGFIKAKVDLQGNVIEVMDTE